MALKRLEEHKVPTARRSHSGGLDRLHFAIRNVETCEWQGERNEAEYVISDFELLLCTGGSAVVGQDGLTGTLKAGSAVLLLPFRPFTLAPQDGEALRCRSVHFLVEPVYLERTLCGISREEGKLVFPLSDTGRMEEMLDIGIRQMDARQFGGTILLQAAIMLALRDLIPEKVCAAAAEKYPVTQNQADLIERAVELAMAGMDRPLRVNAMIKALETSESRLNKTFNEIMGTSPSRYFMGLKIRLAEELINTSNLTLELVASDLGFSSPFHLSRVYKEAFGISPSRARRAYRERFTK